MTIRLLPLTCALLAAAASADLLTLKNGSRIEGTVVAVNAESVLVKSEVASQTIDRAAVRSIEFGRVLLTGIDGSTYTNKDYRARFVAPAGWAIYAEPGLDFMAKKGDWVAFSRSLPLNGMQDGGTSMLKGAIAGMVSSIPGSTPGAPEETKWGSLTATRVVMDSPQAKMLVLFIHFPEHFVMFAVGASPTEYEAAVQTLKDWEKGFSLVSD